MPPEALAWAFEVLGPGEAHLVKERPTRHEVRLLDALARWDVPHTLVPVAVDAENGWILLPDGGSTVRGTPLADPAAARRWAGVLAGYGQTQRATEEHAEELVALGVPDLRLPGLGTAFEDLAHRWAPYVLPLLPRLRYEITELAELGPAATLQHDDLHDGNVFADGRPFDWGDACVGHPFSSLLVALDGGPAPAEYLENWPGVPDRAVELGVRLGRITRGHSWARALEA